MNSEDLKENNLRLPNIIMSNQQPLGVVASSNSPVPSSTKKRHKGKGSEIVSKVFQSYDPKY
jgi:hypothetical protein